MLKGFPPSSLKLAFPPVETVRELFFRVLFHFIKHMNISQSTPGVLVMDNHLSCISLHAINIAKENELLC